LERTTRDQALWRRCVSQSREERREWLKAPPKFEIIATNLPKEQEQKLREAFA